MVLISRRRILRGAGAAAVVCALEAPTRGRTEPAEAEIKLKRGVNAYPWFSLTREYPAPRTDYPWPPFQTDRPVPTPRDLSRLHEAGFDFLRIPVDPGPFLAADGPVRRRLLGELKTAVEQALAAGLRAVVNVQANEATHYWTSATMSASPDAPEFPKYLALIESLAALLALFDPRRVAIEPLNEPGGDCDSADAARVRLALLAKARSVAPRLSLIASGGCGSLIQGLQSFDPAPLEALRPLLYTFHFYEPYLFTHQGAPWMSEPVYRSLHGVPWPASEGSLERTLAAVRARMGQDLETSPAGKASAYRETERVLKVYFDARPARPFLLNYLKMADDWARRHAIASDRVLMGEFGALGSDAHTFGAAAPDRARYVRDVRLAAESFGFPWAFWCLFSAMGLLDDGARQFDPAMLEALGMTMPRG